MLTRWCEVVDLPSGQAGAALRRGADALEEELALHKTRVHEGRQRNSNSSRVGSPMSSSRYARRGPPTRTSPVGPEAAGFQATTMTVLPSSLPLLASWCTVGSSS